MTYYDTTKVDREGYFLPKGYLLRVVCLNINIKLFTSLSPVWVLHIPQRNHIGIIDGIKHFKGICYVAGDERDDLAHIRVLQNGIQVLHDRLNLLLVKGVKDRVKRNRCNRGGQPQGRFREKVRAILCVVVNQGHRHIDGVNYEVLLWHTAGSGRSIGSCVLMVSMELRTVVRSRACAIFLIKIDYSTSTAVRELEPTAKLMLGQDVGIGAGLSSQSRRLPGWDSAVAHIRHAGPCRGDSGDASSGRLRFCVVIGGSHFTGGVHSTTNCRLYRRNNYYRVVAWPALQGRIPS